MASATLDTQPKAILRFGGWDGLFVLLAGIQGVALLQLPSIPLIALGLWWNANTISHNFIHRPFFSSRTLNLGFSAYLSVLLGFPQSLWRERHLAHHNDARNNLRFTTQMFVESLLILTLWVGLALWDLQFFLLIYFPGYVAGLGLCALQGHYEHTPAATSHYGALYNLLCFNDGYHAEHHINPAMHWRRLPQNIRYGATTSRWPPLLRWLDELNLDNLERLVLRSSLLQRFVLRCHRRALRKLVPHLPAVRRIAVVGGGLFPRTALILCELLPGAEITIIDASSRNLERARSILQTHHDHRARMHYVNEWFEPGKSLDCDLLVVPLALKGDRSALYRQHRSTVLVHDWIWHPRGISRVVSPLLLKRINLVMK
jgi:hypothetical protein